MTVGELRKIIAGLSDETRVVRANDCADLGEDFREVDFVFMRRLRWDESYHCWREGGDVTDRCLCIGEADSRIGTDEQI